MRWGTLLWVTSVTVGTFVLSFLAVAFLLVKLPPTYFLDSYDRNLWVDRHPLIRWSGIVLKNFVGTLLILLGGILSIPGIPGQGLLTILIGVMLIDFPGKRRLERAILRRPRIRTFVNRLRVRFGQPPLILVQCRRKS